MTTRKEAPEQGLVGQFIKEKFRDLEGHLILRYIGKRFFYWESGVYREIDSEEVKLGFTRWAAHKNFKNFKNTRHQAEEALHYVRMATTVESGNGSIQNRYFSRNENERYIAFNNGIVCLDDLLRLPLEKVKVNEQSPDFFNLAKIPFEFKPRARASTWNQIIEKVVPNIEDRKILKQWFGYHLIPSLSYSKMIFLEGSGANGKSVALLVLRLMLGEENVSSLPISAFDYDKPFRLAVTEGKLANICEEMGPSGPRIEETIKQFVNGGAFTVEKKFKDPFTLYPTAKLTFATNEMPSFCDRSSGFWRRMLYIKFSVTIAPSEQNKDFLERDFWLRSGELSGVLNWAIEGAKEILEDGGFLESQRKIKEIENLFSEADLLRPWVKDHLVEGTVSDFVSTSQIFSKLRDEIMNGQLPRVSQRELLKEIKAQFPNSERPSNARLVSPGKRVRVICGIRWHTDVTGLV